MVLRVISGTATQQLGTDRLIEPLRSVLVEGLAAGCFPEARPELDIRTISAITFEAANWVRLGVPKLSRREATKHVLRFTRAALGVGT
jgi:hypothetical protein